MGEYDFSQTNIETEAFDAQHKKLLFIGRKLNPKVEKIDFFKFWKGKERMFIRTGNNLIIFKNN